MWVLPAYDDVMFAGISIVMAGNSRPAARPVTITVTCNSENYMLLLSISHGKDTGEISSVAMRWLTGSLPAELHPVTSHNFFISTQHCVVVCLLIVTFACVRS